MAKQTAERPEPRAPLSRDRMLHAAIHLADESGIDALSMRKLAQELGVEAMSLYHYVARKDDILDGMLDVVFGEIDVPSTGGWRHAIRTMAISTHEVLLRHRWACGLLMSSARITDARLRHMDTVLGRLREAGFTDALTDHAYHAIDSYVVGFTLWLLPYLKIAREEPDFAERFYAELPIDELPHLAAHIEWHMAPARPDAVNAFEFGLDLILDGLERLRDAG